MARGLDWEAARRRDLTRKGVPADEVEPPRLKPGHGLPMSPRQRKYLTALCLKHGRTFDPTMSRREASALIRKLVGRRTQPPKQ